VTVTVFPTASPRPRNHPRLLHQHLRLPDRRIVDQPSIQRHRALAFRLRRPHRLQCFDNAVAVTGFQIEDGLSYNWHRTYDPALGRYSQADPLGFVDGPNVFGYAQSSPAMKVDPRGLHSPEFVWPEFNPYVPFTWLPYVQPLWKICIDMMVAKGNVLPSNVQEAWVAAGGPPDKCKWLKENRDKFKPADVKTAEKAWGCRRSRANR
jgi:RHS repeat-associated protein